METQIKEELDDVSICTSGELGNLTLIEKYDRFQMGHDPDSGGESDEDLFSNDTIREEYALMKRNTANYMRPSDHKSSNHQIRKHKADVESRNGNEKRESPTDQNPDIINFDKSIEQLNNVKRCEPISCTEEELNKISDTYAQILRFIEMKANNSFEVEVEDIKINDSELLAEKIESLRLVRDEFYEIQQQVREYIEQLELVERYKMESVG